MQFAFICFKVVLVAYTHLKKSGKVKKFQYGQGKVREMSEKTVLGLPH